MLAVHATPRLCRPGACLAPASHSSPALPNCPGPGAGCAHAPRVAAGLRGAVQDSGGDCCQAGGAAAGGRGRQAQGGAGKNGRGRKGETKTAQCGGSLRAGRWLEDFRLLCILAANTCGQSKHLPYPLLLLAGVPVSPCHGGGAQGQGGAGFEACGRADAGGQWGASGAGGGMGTMP